MNSSDAVFVHNTDAISPQSKQAPTPSRWSGARRESRRIATGGPLSGAARFISQVEWACKPDSVVCDHLSGITVADDLARAYPSVGRADLSRSYLLLLRMGFAKPPRCRDAGALLPHRFSFSPAGEPAGESSFLWHFPSAHAAQQLAGILPCGVRTFLTPLPTRGRPAHSVDKSSSRQSAVPNECRRATGRKRSREGSERTRAALVGGSRIQLVARTGFEPVISALRGRCPNR